eukprot:364560-Chlamydomonas_euryale.AAC.11
MGETIASTICTRVHGDEGKHGGTTHPRACARCWGNMGEPLICSRARVHGDGGNCRGAARMRACA